MQTWKSSLVVTPIFEYLCHHWGLSIIPFEFLKVPPSFISNTRLHARNNDPHREPIRGMKLFLERFVISCAFAKLLIQKFPLSSVLTTNIMIRTGLNLRHQWTYLLTDIYIISTLSSCCISVTTISEFTSANLRHIPLFHWSIPFSHLLDPEPADPYLRWMTLSFWSINYTPVEKRLTKLFDSEFYI